LLRSDDLSLHPQCKVPSEPLELASLLGTELIGPELDLDLLERATELERHLRVVLVDDRRSGVLADVKAFVQREPEGYEISGACALAGTVAADNAQDLALRDLETHILKGPEYLDLVSLKYLSPAGGVGRLACKLRSSRPITSRNVV
jgi:hypothetical protein